MSNSAKLHDREDEAFEVGKAACIAKSIATALRPDLNALLAIWMCQRIRLHSKLPALEVAFIPASTNAVTAGVLGIDLGLGKGLRRFGHGKSIKRSAIKGSCAMAFFRALPEDDQEALEPLVKAVSGASESGENPFTEFYNQLLAVNAGHSVYQKQIMASTIWAVYESLSYVLSDHELLKHWSTVFDGYIAGGMKKRMVFQASQDAEYLFDGELAILPNGAPQQTSKEAFKNGAKLVVFSSYLGADHWILGVTRKSGDEASYIDLNEHQNILKRHLPEIYVHQGGFMAGWTIKSPLVCKAEDFRARRLELINAVIELMGKVTTYPA